jgi:hypothetical protein
MSNDNPAVIVERASQGAAELVLRAESPGPRSPGCILFLLQHDSRSSGARGSARPH